MGSSVLQYSCYDSLQYCRDVLIEFCFMANPYDFVMDSALQHPISRFQTFIECLGHLSNLSYSASPSWFLGFFVFALSRCILFCDWCFWSLPKHVSSHLWTITILCWSILMKTWFSSVQTVFPFEGLLWRWCDSQLQVGSLFTSFDTCVSMVWLPFMNGAGVPFEQVTCHKFHTFDG